MNTPIQVAWLSRRGRPSPAIQTLLSLPRFQTRVFSLGADLIHHIGGAHVDLLLIDQEPADVRTVDVIRAVRGVCSHNVPIMILSDAQSEDGLIDAFDAGADDFVFGCPSEGALLARISALHRRATSGTRASPSLGLRVGDYELNSVGRFATLRGKRIALTPKEFDLAVLLFANVGRVVANKEIEHIIWGQDLPALSRALAGLVSRMRRTLDLRPSNGVTIRVVYAKGYRLDVLDNRTTMLLADQNAPRELAAA